jgi:hypothetical protein
MVLADEDREDDPPQDPVPHSPPAVCDVGEHLSTTTRGRKQQVVFDHVGNATSVNLGDPALAGPQLLLICAQQ